MGASIDISDIVNFSVVVSPTAIPYSNFGLPLILGSSSIIDVNQRYRSYSTLAGVATDFGTTAPEYLAAVPYFGQTPQPNQLLIGRWAQVATPGILHGATLTAAQQILANFTAITTGSFVISIDGTAHTLTGLNFSTALNLNGVASIIQTVIAAYTGESAAKCVWSSTYARFDVVSGTTGPTSSVSFATAGTGTDVSTLLGLSAAAGASPLVAGMAAETMLAAVQALAAASSQWYMLTVAPLVAAAIGATAAAPAPQPSDHISVGAYILASARTRRYGVTINTTDCLDPTQTSDLASVIQAANNKRMFWQYSSSNLFAVMSFIGRASTVNFNAQNATITLAFKQEPGITAEGLNETQMATMRAKGGNAFLNVDNGASIIWPGQNSDGSFWDEVHGYDWFQNRLTTDAFNLLYQSGTKIPQTDDGAHQVLTTLSTSCDAAVFNGYAAPGQWNAGGFGQLQQGMVLSTGYYLYCAPMATQSQALRETRIMPPILIALKLAGAIQGISGTLNINR